jgi:hypothetical protein
VGRASRRSRVSCGSSRRPGRSGGNERA